MEKSPHKSLRRLSESDFLSSRNRKIGMLEVRKASKVGNGLTLRTYTNWKKISHVIGNGNNTSQEC